MKFELKRTTIEEIVAEKLFLQKNKFTDLMLKNYNRSVVNGIFPIFLLLDNFKE